MEGHDPSAAPQSPALLLRPTGRELARRLSDVSRRRLRQRTARVHFAGRPLSDHERIDVGPASVEVTYRQRSFLLRATLPPLLALWKPPGTISSHRDDHGMRPTVFERVAAAGFRLPVEAVGRLDADTEGVLLLSVDGELVHRLAHPRHSVSRSYLAWPTGEISALAAASVRAGTVRLRDGHVPAPAAFERASPDLVRGLPEPANDAGPAPWFVTLTEGKYHEVRRIFGALETRLRRLVRVSFGPVDRSVFPCIAPPEGAVVRLDEARTRAVYACVGLVPEPWLEVAPALGESDDCPSPESTGQDESCERHEDA